MVGGRDASSGRAVWQEEHARQRPGSDRFRFPATRKWVSAAERRAAVVACADGEQEAHSDSEMRKGRTYSRPEQDT